MISIRGREGRQLMLLVLRKKSARDRRVVEVLTELFHIDADVTSPCECQQGHVTGMRNVELHRILRLRRSQRRLFFF